MRKRERQIKVKNLGKRGWHNSAKIRERVVQVNPVLNLDKKDWPVNLYIKKKKLQMNLLNVDNRDWQIHVSMRKKNVKESVECRQQRLANQRQYEKEKIANDPCELNSQFSGNS